MQMDRRQLLHQIANLDHYDFMPIQAACKVAILEEITLLIVKAHHDFGQANQEPYIATALQRFAMMVAREKIQHVQVCSWWSRWA